MLYLALKALWSIAAQWTDWAQVMGTANAALGVLNLLVVTAALGVSVVGLWRYRPWGWSFAFVVFSLGLAGAVYVQVVDPRQHLALLALLHAVALAVLLFSPLRRAFDGSRLLAWWEGEPTKARLLGTSLGIVQSTVAVLCLLVLLAGSVYGGFNLAAVLFVIAGIIAGVILFVSSGLPAYGFVITWCATALIFVARFVAEDPGRHRTDGTTRLLVAYCTVAGLFLTLTIGHEVFWRVHQRGRPRAGDRVPS